MKPDQAGVTLVEMLIALAVFSSIAVSSLFMMRLGMDSHQQFNTVTEYLMSFDRSRSLIKSDLLQISNRIPRDTLGQKSVSAVRGGSYLRGVSRIDDGEKILLAFVRNGNPNPGSRYPVSSLHYIEYRLIGKDIVRRAWPYVDLLEETPYADQLLFEGVSSVNISFFHADRWRNQWLGRPDILVPQALEIKFSHKILGPVHQIFHIPPVG